MGIPARHVLARDAGFLTTRHARVPVFLPPPLRELARRECHLAQTRLVPRSDLLLLPRRPGLLIQRLYSCSPQRPVIVSVSTGSVTSFNVVDHCYLLPVSTNIQSERRLAQLNLSLV